MKYVENWQQVRAELLKDAYIWESSQGYRIEYDNSQYTLIDTYDGIDIGEIVDDQEQLYGAIYDCRPVLTREYEEWSSYDRV